MLKSNMQSTNLCASSQGHNFRWRDFILVDCTNASLCDLDMSEDYTLSDLSIYES